mmetsp:Transcript_123094/g.298913  ORF Transcript_123094/g.298913 Transcript_123094/m.298913 type:complete len:112 (-) Transcript_123094:32-367(-)
MARVLYRAPKVPTLAIVATMLGTGYAARGLLMHRAKESYVEETASQQRAIRTFLDAGHGPPAVDWRRVRARVMQEEERLAAAGLGRPPADVPTVDVLRAQVTMRVRTSAGE